MNYWTKQSIKIAGGPGYLDKLHAVYPVVEGLSSVKLSLAQKNEIAQLLSGDKRVALLNFLFKLKRFPYDEPFAGFLRQHPAALKQNPKTMRRIWAKLSKMGLSGVVEGIERPMSASRRFGQTFRNWMGSVVDSCDAKHVSSAKKPVSINAADSVLAKYAFRNLGYKRKKGLDLIILGRRLSVFGEAKFISTTGGTQDKSFRESVDFVRKYSSKRAMAIAIIDGVVWAPSLFKSSKSLYAKELGRLGNDHIVMSALLLPEFIRKELR